MIREGLTLREIARRYNRSKATFCGTAAQVVDHMESLDGRRRLRRLHDLVPGAAQHLARLRRQSGSGTTARGLFRTTTPPHAA